MEVFQAQKKENKVHDDRSHERNQLQEPNCRVLWLVTIEPPQAKVLDFEEQQYAHTNVASGKNGRF